MVEVQVKETKSVRASEVVQVAEGESQILVRLPASVPVGKRLDLRIEVSGTYQDAAE